jgi:hypothetical protein
LATDTPATDEPGAPAPPDESASPIPDEELSQAGQSCLAACALVAPVTRGTHPRGHVGTHRLPAGARRQAPGGAAPRGAANARQGGQIPGGSRKVAAVPDLRRVLTPRYQPTDSDEHDVLRTRHVVPSTRNVACRGRMPTRVPLRSSDRFPSSRWADPSRRTHRGISEPTQRRAASLTALAESALALALR